MRLEHEDVWEKVGLMTSKNGLIESYITHETIYSGLSKSNFKDHYGDAATEQCLGKIAEMCF